MAGEKMFLKILLQFTVPLDNLQSGHNGKSRFLKLLGFAFMWKSLCRQLRCKLQHATHPTHAFSSQACVFLKPAPSFVCDVQIMIESLVNKIFFEAAWKFNIKSYTCYKIENIISVRRICTFLIPLLVKKQNSKKPENPCSNDQSYQERGTRNVNWY